MKADGAILEQAASEVMQLSDSGRSWAALRLNSTNQ
jgi:hypothetical protein